MARVRSMSTLNWSGIKQAALLAYSEDRVNEVSEDVYYHIYEKLNRAEKQTTKSSGLYFAGNTDRWINKSHAVPERYW